MVLCSLHSNLKWKALVQAINGPLKKHHNTASKEWLCSHLRRHILIYDITDINHFLWRSVMQTSLKDLKKAVLGH